MNLTEEKNKYVLYEYLLYFWKKKWYFLIVPIITAVLIAGGVYLLKSNPAYTGKVLFYIGSINSQELSHPDNVMAKIDETGLNNPVDAFVSEKGQIKFTIPGNSKEAVEADVNTIIQVFGDSLQESADIRIEVTSERLATLDKRIEALRVNLKDYNEDLKNVYPEDYEALSDLIIETEEELTEIDERAYKLRSDIELFEQPKVLSQSVTKSNTYLKESIAVGILVGLVLTVLLLLLLKYLGDARRHYQE